MDFCIIIIIIIKVLKIYFNKLLITRDNKSEFKFKIFLLKISHIARRTMRDRRSSKHGQHNACIYLIIHKCDSFVNTNIIKDYIPD